MKKKYIFIFIIIIACLSSFLLFAVPEDGDITVTNSFSCSEKVTTIKWSDPDGDWHVKSAKVKISPSKGWSKVVSDGFAMITWSLPGTYNVTVSVKYKNSKTNENTTIHTNPDPLIVQVSGLRSVSADKKAICRLESVELKALTIDGASTIEAEWSSNVPGTFSNNGIGGTVNWRPSLAYTSNVVDDVILTAKACGVEKFVKLTVFAAKEFYIKRGKSPICSNGSLSEEDFVIIMQPTGFKLTWDWEGSSNFGEEAIEKFSFLKSSDGTVCHVAPYKVLGSKEHEETPTPNLIDDGPRNGVVTSESHNVVFTMEKFKDNVISKSTNTFIPIKRSGPGPCGGGHQIWSSTGHSTAKNISLTLAEVLNVGLVYTFSITDNEQFSLAAEPGKECLASSGTGESSNSLV